MFNLKSEFELEKLKATKANYFRTTSLHMWSQSFDLNHSISLTFLATNVNHFEFSIIHSNKHESKTLKRLKKSAQLVRVFLRNGFSFKLSKNHSRTINYVVLNSKLLERLQNRMNAIQFKAQKTIENSHSIKLTSIQSKSKLQMQQAMLYSNNWTINHCRLNSRRIMKCSISNKQ